MIGNIYFVLVRCKETFMLVTFPLVMVNEFVSARYPGYVTVAL